MNNPVYTYDYDSSYIPAFPVAEVIINGYDQPRTALSLSALVDSGSDASMIPLAILQQIKATQIGRANIRGIIGRSRRVDLFEVGLKIAGHDIPWLVVAADRENQQMILGRDVLNHFTVTLNGLANTVEISQ
jgi:hypothetical protein